MNKQKPLVLIGGGGHASVLADILLGQGRDIVAVICPDDISKRKIFSNIPHYTNDEDVLRFEPDEVLLVNGIGMLAKSITRKCINEHFLELGYQFETVIAQSSTVSKYATIESGVQVFPQAVVQAGSIIMEHSIINTGAIIEHDCRIGAYNHVAPRAVLCGGVETEENVFLGASSTVIQGICVRRSSVIAAGVTIIKNVEENVTVISSSVTKLN